MSENTIPPLDGTLGAVEIGLVVSTLLFGVETLQTFHYYRHFRGDFSALKTLVAVVWWLEIGHSICGWHSLYSMTVTFYGQPQHILDPPISLAVLPVFSSVLITLVQGFFCMRIGRLSGSWSLARMCFLFSTIPFVLTLTTVAMYHNSKAGLVVFQTGLGRVLLVVTTALQPPAHVLIAGALCYQLWRFRAPNLSVNVHTIVDRLIIWTVETTLITCMVSLGDLIMILTRQNLAWMAFYLVQSKLLSNTMMASLKVGTGTAVKLSRSTRNLAKGYVSYPANQGARTSPSKCFQQGNQVGSKLRAYQPSRFEVNKDTGEP